MEATWFVCSIASPKYDDVELIAAKLMKINMRINDMGFHNNNAINQGMSQCCPHLVVLSLALHGLYGPSFCNHTPLVKT